MTWGDELDTLTRERGSALVGYAYLLCGDLPTAQDLVQEAISRTFGRPRTAHDLTWVEAYVRRTVLNLYLDSWRRARVWGRVRHLAVDPDRERREHLDTRTADHVDVQQALAALPARERACVVLRFYEDLTVPAIAQELGLSQGAVKRYLSDASTRLRTALGPARVPEPAETTPVHTVPGSTR